MQEIVGLLQWDLTQWRKSKGEGSRMVWTNQNEEPAQVKFLASRNKIDAARAKSCKVLWYI